ncbi:hypothetical protein D3C84_821690 [compost metagenome]
MADRVEVMTFGLPISNRLRCNFAARRGTFSPPGRMPSCTSPCSTHSRITDQMCSRPWRISSSLRQARSLAIINSPTRRPCWLQSLSSSAALEKSYGSTTWLAGATPDSASAASMMKPPPIE